MRDDRRPPAPLWTILVFSVLGLVGIFAALGLAILQGVPEALPPLAAGVGLLVPAWRWLTAWSD